MKMTMLRLAGGALALLTLGLTAARGDDGTARPSPSAAVFQVDTAASRLYVKVAASGRLGHDHGVQGPLESGTITLGGTGTLVFAMRKFVTDTPEARRYVGLSGTVSEGDRQKTVATMLGPQVLDVARFPTATYEIAAAVPLDNQAPGDPGRYKLDGQFTLHGAARQQPLIAQVDRTETAGVLRMRCAFAIEQTSFGIRPYSTLGGIVGVADRLDIRGDLLIRPAAR
jgi:polyisoprenoid-binding protein YceI